MEGSSFDFMVCQYVKINILAQGLKSKMCKECKVLYSFPPRNPLLTCPSTNYQFVPDLQSFANYLFVKPDFICYFSIYSILLWSQIYC